ncbi:MAG TPA: acyl-CoA dehydrogenase family protein, partial [Candidatus Dormibacteraeota bacterium]|nr:acyl-CoA dehydrogenase family protein [Candidatus Dormibacteraeota bacterium]
MLTPVATTHPRTRPASLPPATDLYAVDELLGDDERLVRDTVRGFAAERAAPYIADWFEAGTLPRELAP